MPLQFILGSSGSGKSYHLYNQVIRKSMEHSDINYLVIVPEQFTMQTQKDLVSMHPRHGVMNIDILSFLRLAYRIFEEVGHKDQLVLEDTGKSMLLRKVVAEHKKELILFQSDVKKQGFISELKSLMSEIFQYSITEEELEHMEELAEKRPMLQAKIKDIRLIYSAFKRMIHEQYITAEEILDVLIDVVDQSEILKNSVICFDGFTGFTPCQYKLLSKLMLIAKNVIVTVTIDKRENPSVLDEEYKLFHMSKKTIYKLTSIAEEVGVSILPHIYAEDMNGAEVPYRFKDSKALAALEHNLFRYPQKVYNEEQEDIEILEFMDAGKEVRFCIREIKRLVREAGYRYMDIAVVTGDIETYGRIFRRDMEREGIPCFIDNKKDILSNPYVECLRTVIELVIRDFSYETVFRFLRSGMLDFEKEDIDYIENYVIAYGIRGHSMWSKTWKENEHKSQLYDMEWINGLREEIITMLEPLYQVLSDKKSNAEMITRALYAFSVQIHAGEKLFQYVEHFKEKNLLLLAKEYEQIYRIVCELFEQFVELIGDEIMPLSDYIKVFESGLTEAKVGLIPPGMDQIVIGDTTRTRLKDIKALFFVGVNDGIIPGANNGGGILSDLDRELFAENQVELAPTKRQNAYMEQFYLYMNMTKPKNKLYLTYHKTDASGKTARPSYLIGKILKMYPKLSVIDDDDTESIEKTIGTNGGIDYLIQCLRDDREKEKTPLFEELFSYYAASENSQDLIQSLIDGAFYRNHEHGIGKYTANLLYGNELEASATRFERYASCAFAHFMAYGMLLKERAEYKLATPDIGSIFHLAINLFSEKLTKSEYDWSTLPDEIREEWSSYCVRTAVENYGNTVLHSNKRNEYLIKRVDRIHKRTVWALSEQMKTTSFRPIGYEVPFGYSLERKTDTQIPLKLVGRIDRLDAYEDMQQLFLSVVDYKTGNVSLDLPSLYYGLQMQLAVYLSAAIELAQKKYSGKEIVPAGMLYYHMDDPIIDRTDDVQQALLKKFRMNGLVSEQPEIIKKLDQNFDSGEEQIQGGVKSKVIPVDTNVNGTFSRTSKIATNREFHLLTDYVKRKMDQLGEDIMSGCTDINPYKMGKRTACDYCEYNGICGFDTKLPGYRYRKLKALEKAEAFESMNEEVKEDEMDQGSTEGNRPSE